MKRQEPNPASAKEQAEGSRKNVNAGPNRAEKGADEFNPKPGPDGKNDAGPEPDVLGQEIPPQD